MSRAKAKALKSSNNKKFKALYKKAGGETERKARQASRPERSKAWKVKVFGGSTKPKKAAPKKATRKSVKGKRSTLGKDGRKYYFVDGKRVTAAVYSKAKVNPRRRNGTKKGQVRKTARPAYMRNGTKKGQVRKTSRRAYQGLKLNPNGGSTGIMPIDAATKMVDQVPLVGSTVAPYVAPLVVGAGSAAVSFYLMREFGPKLPEKMQPFGYSLGGVVAGTAVAAIPVGKVQSRRLVAAGLVTVGAAIDLYRYLMTMSAEDAESASGAEASAEEALNGFGSWEYTGQGALNGYAGLELIENPGYGALEYTGQGALNGYGALEYTGQGALNGYGALELDYSDASLGDAYASPGDFGADELRAFRGGPQHWRKYFGQSARRARGVRSAQSRHAGKPGHRWGWLIKLIGFDKARGLAQLQPAQRMQVINGLKAQALEALPELMSQASSTEESGSFIAPPSEDLFQVANGADGPSGADGVGGYGSLLFTGNPY
jgi:hypothetical protein